MKKIQEARCVSMHTYECAHVCINKYAYMYSAVHRQV